MSGWLAVGVFVTCAAVSYWAGCRSHRVAVLRARMRGDVIDLAAERRMRALARAVDRHPAGRVS